MIVERLPGGALWGALAVLILSVLYVFWTALSPAGRKDERTRLILSKAAAAALPWVFCLLAVQTALAVWFSGWWIHPLLSLAAGCLVFDLTLVYYRRKYGC